MRIPEVGDYIVGSTKIYEIVAIEPMGEIESGNGGLSGFNINTTYSVQEINDPGGFLEYEEATYHISFTTSGISLSKLRHMGEIIPKEEASKAIEILFKK